MDSSNVDLRCAVRADLFFKGAARLPVRGIALASDDRPRDICGRPRSRATMPAFRRGISPANAGQKYPATPPTSEQIAAMLAACGPSPAGRRLHALIVLREGLPIIYVSRQLGHTNVGTTATYLAGISNDEVVRAVMARPAPIGAAA